MKKYLFGKGQWNAADFRYVYSPRVRPGAKFTQEADCVVNRPSDAEEKFEYISLLSNEKQHEGVLLQTNCSFEHFGAPLLAFSSDMTQQENGDWRYGVHFEVVAYEGGLNVWRIDPVGDSAKSTNLLREKFPVEEKAVHCLTARVWHDRLEMTLDDHRVTLEGTFPAEFYAGITACEGINRFYDFSMDA